MSATSSLARPSADLLYSRTSTLLQRFTVLLLAAQVFCGTATRRTSLALHSTRGGELSESDSESERLDGRPRIEETAFALIDHAHNSESGKKGPMKCLTKGGSDNIMEVTDNIADCVFVTRALYATRKGTKTYRLQEKDGDHCLKWSDSKHGWKIQPCVKKKVGQEFHARKPRYLCAFTAVREGWFSWHKTGETNCLELVSKGWLQVQRQLLKLDTLVGLAQIKSQVREHISRIQFDADRAHLGFKSLGADSMHMRFLGNPGTGKTVIARIIGNILTSLGAITSSERAADAEMPFIEVARKDLVAEYTGQTAPKVQAAVEDAIGGVLFVDEAYALVQDDRDSMGREAVDTLIKEMEDHRGDLIVILAGYSAEMDAFFDSNPGFKSRVPFTFNFDDYTCGQLLTIGDLQMQKNGVYLWQENKPLAAQDKGIGFCEEDCKEGVCNDPQCQEFLQNVQLQTRCCISLDECPHLNMLRDNGNGRAVRNILESAIRQMAARAMRTPGLPTKKPGSGWFSSSTSDADKELAAKSYEFLQQADLWGARKQIFKLKYKEVCGSNAVIAWDAVESISAEMWPEAVVSLWGTSCEAAEHAFGGDQLGTGTAGGKDPDEIPPCEEQRLKGEPLVQELCSLIALDGIKESVLLLRNMLLFDAARKRYFGADAKSVMGQSYHMMFLGNPGTGKTVVARLVAKILGDFNILGAEGSPPFVEASRQDLVAEYMGQTAPKVAALVKKAFGGVLFIDEAYALNRGDKDTYGQEAVDTLIKEMEDHKDKVTVILAGYEKEMRDFIDTNPGFKSRVPYSFAFEDYTCGELSQIANLQMKSKRMEVSDPTAKSALGKAIAFDSMCCEEKGSCAGNAGRANGNGRAVRNLLEESYRQLATRVVTADPQGKNVKSSTLTNILEPDVQIALGSRVGPRLRAMTCTVETKSSTADVTRLVTEHTYKELGALAFESGFAKAVAENDCEQALFYAAAGGLGSGSEEAEPEEEVEEAEPELRGSPTRALQEAFAGLRNLVGLRKVKEAVVELHDLVTFDAWRKKQRWFREKHSLLGQSFHMKFVGNPGTGKTVVARHMGKMLGLMGIISAPKDGKYVVPDWCRKGARVFANGTSAKITIEKIEWPSGQNTPMVDLEVQVKDPDSEGTKRETFTGSNVYKVIDGEKRYCEPSERDSSETFVEAGRGELVAQYTGQTAPLVQSMVGQALGGVLFVDEAYALKRDERDSFGQEAVDTLIKEMEDHRKELVVILAGYTAEMDFFMKSNPGFSSRVPFSFHFDDYSCNELALIGRKMLQSKQLRIGHSSEDWLDRGIRFTTGCCDHGDFACENAPRRRASGNARAVRNICEAATRAMAVRVEKVKPDKDQDPEGKKLYSTLISRDLQSSAQKAAQDKLEHLCRAEGQLKILGRSASSALKRPGILRRELRALGLGTDDASLVGTLVQGGENINRFEKEFGANYEAKHPFSKGGLVGRGASTSFTEAEAESESWKSESELPPALEALRRNCREAVESAEASVTTTIEEIIEELGRHDGSALDTKQAARQADLLDDLVTLKVLSEGMPWAPQSEEVLRRAKDQIAETMKLEVQTDAERLARRMDLRLESITTAREKWLSA